MPVTVVVGNLLGLHHQVRMVGTEGLTLVQFQRLEQVEHFEHGEALRGRRCFVNGHVAVLPADGLAPARGLGAQVVGGEEATARLGKRSESPAHIAVIEPGPAMRAELCNRACEVGVAQQTAGAWRLATRQKDRRRLGVHAQVGLGTFDPAGQSLRYREAVTRIVVGALQVISEREFSVSLVGLDPARHRARRGERGREHAAKRNFAVAAI